MSDYTIEVYDTEADPTEKLYEFVSEGVQAVIASRPWAVQWTENPDREPNEDPIWRDIDDDDWHFTKVPIYDPPDPDAFWLDVRSDSRSIDILDSDGSELVSSGLLERTHTTAIAWPTAVVDGETIEEPDGGGTIDEGLFFFYFHDVVSGLPPEHLGPGEPSYPTPWGREVEGLGYCW